MSGQAIVLATGGTGGHMFPAQALVVNGCADKVVKAHEGKFYVLFEVKILLYKLFRAQFYRFRGG